LLDREKAPPLAALWFIFADLVPFVFVYVLVRRKTITDIHIKLRQQRTLPFVVSAISAIVLIVIYKMIDVPKPIMAISTLLLVDGIAFLLLTLKFKFSVHMAGLVGSAIAIAVLVNMHWLWLLLAMPVVGWGRIYRKRHTLRQVVAGAIIATIITSAVLGLFGYL